ncbi:hemolysin-III related-domain-containing protein [Penicillium waksmanii]|uniref:hemolysin-III related-domain-containing protein n=1 Tax=Penicillium waksmanii TaxID=69791 RepID=UPI002547EF2A|nr:hemolysin-III related-domain-containing protein [Penicillium waksmanii]KAJ6001000.1 hemolysin-III related-domain-containing protein [Penicillium waksmanii]
MSLQWDKLSSWQRDNQQILLGYRTSSNSFSKSFTSLIYIHNESVNIYSHLIPAVIISLFSISFYTALARRYASVSAADALVFGCFFLGAVLCLAISAIFHTVQNHSSRVARIANQVDYIGIILLIVGSFIPSIFYGFYYHPNLQRVYLTMVCPHLLLGHSPLHRFSKITSLGLLCAAISANPQFRHPTWRPFRAGMFISLGLSALFPVVHGAMKFGLKQINRQIGLFWVALQERISPGLFDIWISSHQIFHIMVVLAIISHLRGLVNAFDYNHSVMALHC